jgi:hypothetical protein
MEFRLGSPRLAVCETSGRRTRTWPLALLCAVHLLAHFVPFERASGAPDDYVAQWRLASTPAASLVRACVTDPARPVMLSVHYGLSAMVDPASPGALGLLVVASFLPVLLLYLLVRQLCDDAAAALLVALLYALLPNKLELYHTFIYVHVNLVYALYLGALLAFVVSAHPGRRRVLYVGLALYTIAIFWYEPGLLLPIVLAGIARYQRRPARDWAVFVAPLLFYAAFRLTGAFGWHDSGIVVLDSPRQVNLLVVLHNAFVSVPNHYLGRYLLRAAAYGLYAFATMPKGLVFCFAVADATAVIVFARRLRSQAAPRIDRGVAGLGLLMFVVFLVPNVLYIVEGRHTALASAGVAILVIAGMARLTRWWRPLLLVVLAGGLLVSQGTAWHEVLACRLNAAVFYALQESRGDVQRSARVLVDTRSFADRIPYTWSDTRENVLDAYYGVQAFAPWGLRAMVDLAAGRTVPVHIARSRPMPEGTDWVFEAKSLYAGARQAVPREGTWVIDFDRVYPPGRGTAPVTRR